MLVFLYGTLKTGEPAHHLLRLKGQCTFKGKGITVEKYPLVVTTKYNGPFLLYKPGTGNNIEGEVYEVDEDCLAHIDDVEYHPHLYERMSQEIQLTGKDDGQQHIVACDVYFIVQYRDELLELPMYSYFTDGINGKKFIMPEVQSSANLPLHEIHKGFEKKSD